MLKHKVFTRYIVTKRAVRLLWSVIRLLILSAFVVILVYPVYYAVSVALRPVEELYDPLVILVPRKLTLDNIKNALRFLDYGKALLNSAFITGVATLLQIITCSISGYGLARFKFKGDKLIFALVILLIIVPPQTIIVPEYLQFRYFSPLGLGKLLNILAGKKININLVDNPLSLFLPAAFGIGIRSGVIIFIFRQFFRNMPKDLEEAAFIDGCGSFKAFAFIMAPNAVPAFLTTFLFSVVWYWNDYIYSSSLIGNVKTVMNQLNNLNADLSQILEYDLHANPYEGTVLMQAGVIMAILPLLIIYIILQRFFTESIERSGIVG